MNWRNVDANGWLLLLEWIADVMNHTAEESLGWKPPLQTLTGQTIDISIMLYFLFWDVVYVSRYDDTQYKGQIGSEKSSEIRGRFVGFAWSVGHALTFKILTEDTKMIINRSRVRLSKSGENNLKLDVEAGEVPQRVYIRSKRDSEGDNVVLPTIDVTYNPFDTDEHDEEHAEGSDPGETEPINIQENGETRTSDDGENNNTHQKGWVDNEKYHQAFEQEPVDLTGTPEAGTMSQDNPTHVEDKTSARDLQAARRSGGQVQANEVLVETVDDEEEDDDYSPMDDPPLADIPEPDELPAMDEDLTYFKEPTDKPYNVKVTDEMLDFAMEFLRTGRTVEPDLPPEELITRTFLMPPKDDGS